MIVSAVDRKYVAGLVDLAFAEEVADRVGEELERFAGLLREQPELLLLLSNPAIPFSRKREVVSRVAEVMGLHRMVVNFILVVLRNNRIRRLFSMVEGYHRAREERLGIVRAEVYSARPLDDTTIRRLREAVEEFTGKQVKFDMHQDPSLIGGIKLQVGSTVFDASIRTQLNEIRKRIAT